MKNNFHILLLIVMFGFFLMPSLASACEMNSGKSCCSNEISSSKDKMDCCKKENHSKGKHEEGAGGKKKHSSCNCFVFQINVILPTEKEATVLGFIFLDKKDKFIEKETPISSGFSSIWLIPKIS